jgi:cytochrome b pre-mRNA-processing protein 3
MISWLLGRAERRRTIERLHAEIVAASRHPAFFTAGAVADTFEGRFEILTLHAWLVLRRLAGLPAPAPELAQDLTDALFRHFDIALREIGIGDPSVPKHMRRLAEAFLGRCTAYDGALSTGEEALVAALLRNVYGGSGDARGLAHYVSAAEATLARAPFDAFARGPVPFPAPSDLSSLPLSGRIA